MTFDPSSSGNPGIAASQVDIARRFGRAAKSYDAAMSIQREAGAHLCAWAAPAKPNTVLDIGSGSGWWSAYWQQQGARVLAVDIAPAMLQHSRALARGDAWLAADAQALPLASASVDMCFSNMALQWCADWTCAIAEIHRVLKPGGMALLSTLAAGTMQPLQSAWAAVDNTPHSHVFLAEADLHTVVNRLPWQYGQTQAHTHTVYFDDVPSLLQSLRQVGANHVAGRSHGLMGKAKWQAFVQAYQAWQGRDGRLPLHYRVVYWRMCK